MPSKVDFSQDNPRKTPFIQNAVARLLSRTKKRDHTSLRDPITGYQSLTKLTLKPYCLFLNHLMAKDLCIMLHKLYLSNCPHAYCLLFFRFCFYSACNFFSLIFALV